ncbi:MAG: DUF4968 domain-containing protein [Prevotellaceae bacterium]|nr:DUF4968 domain-containing protein [Prevotellaceae bacterium]
MRHLSFIFYLLLSAFALSMQGQEKISFTTEGCEVNVLFYTPSIVRITKTPIGHSFNHSSMVVVTTPEEVNSAIKASRLYPARHSISV